MRQLKINNSVLPIPQKWNELTYDQLLRVAKLCNVKIDYNQARIRLMLELIGLKVVQKKEVVIDGVTYFYLAHGKSNVFLASEIELAYIADTVNFLFSAKTDPNSENIEYYYVDSKLTRSVIDSIKINDSVYYGPSDALTNLNFTEYIHAETFYYMFNKTNDFRYVDSLIAVLFRPQDPQYNPESINYRGDRREKFNDFLIETRAKQISTLDIDIKQAILLYYEGCRKFIREKFPEAFEGAAKTDLNVFESFAYLVDALAEQDITKKEHIRDAYLYDVLPTMNSISKQNKKQ